MLGFHTGKHGKVYHDNKPSKGSAEHNPGSHDGSDNSSREDLTPNVQSAEFENRAWKGIRVVSNEFKYHDKNVFLTIDTHSVKGKYSLEIHNEFQNDRDDLPEIQQYFSKFADVQNYIEDKIGLDMKLKDQAGDDFSWNENIKLTDYELPYERIFWALPQNAKDNHYHHNDNVGREEIPEFINRLHKNKSRHVNHDEIEKIHQDE
jgi:hypothetical protein